MSRIRFLFALWAARFTKAVIRVIAPGRGTSLPGSIALKLDHGFIGHFKNVDKNKVIFITGTNGKSTTTNLLAAIMRQAGKKAAVNLEGANLAAGVAVTLMDHATLGGRFREEYIIMETDERFLPVISRQLPPAWLCVTNIQKDQVQRNGEPDIIYRKITSAIRKDTVLFLNNEEPVSRSFATQTDKAVYYGVEEHAKSFVKHGAFTTTVPCPLCGAPIRFIRYNVDNIGEFACTRCDYASQKAPAYFIHSVDFGQRSFMLGQQKYPLPYDAPYFLYCYAAAIAIAREAGVAESDCLAAMEKFVNIGGRLESLNFGSKTVNYIRMKQENPETLQSALDHIANDKTEKIFMLGLDELVDFDPHYTNTFYAFDCDFDKLIDSHVSRYICFSGTVAYDAANRLVYAGVPKEKISVLATNDDKTILDELAKFPCDNVYLITWLHKYESLEKYIKEHGEGKC